MSLFPRQGQCRNFLVSDWLYMSVFFPDLSSLQFISVSVPSCNLFFLFLSSIQAAVSNIPVHFIFHIPWSLVLVRSASTSYPLCYVVMFVGRRGESNVTMGVCRLNKWISHTSMQNNYSYRTEIKDVLARVLNRGFILSTTHLSLSLQLCLEKCFLTDSSELYACISLCFCVWMTLWFK